MRILSKKRTKRSVESRLLDSSTLKSANSGQEILLNFILSHAKDDCRPYLKISIYGIEFLGLLDSGASRTVIGLHAWNLLKPYCQINTDQQRKCTVASGDQHLALGMVALPINLQDRVKIIEALVVPSFPQSIILGMDFWVRMEIVPHMHSDEWKFVKDNSTEHFAINSINDKGSLSVEQRCDLEKLLDEVFAKMGTRLGCTNVVQHDIKTDHPPIKQRHYPLSPALQLHVNKELEKMLAEGIIEPSNSPWASPIVMVKKPDGSYRFCVDYRQLNRVSIPDAYPLPFVSATLDKLRDARYLTTLDVKSAYWQIPLSPSSKPLTAFVIPNRGLYHFNRMPFGLQNAPATWQRFIDRVIGVDLEKYVFVYLDDVIICTPTFELHLEILSKVLNRIIDAGLTLNREKCHFCKQELRYLGYIVNSSGLLVDPSKVEAIVNLPTPRNVTEVRRIVGLASWYRRFIPKFSSIAAPLTNLLRKNQKFIWDDSCENSLKTIKEHLISAPVLSCPNYELSFLIQTDASDYGLGAVLTQNHNDGEKVVAYLSRSLTKAERKYSTTEKECLAVLFAIEKFRPYVEGTRFTVITDHYSLLWLQKIKDPIGRIARWNLRLQQYDFEIVHRKGKLHCVPDALSRAVPAVDFVENVAVSNQKGPVADNWYLKMKDIVVKSPKQYPLWRVENDKLYKHGIQKYAELNDLDQWLLVVPKHDRSSIIQDHHNPPTCGHLGISKTVERISRGYYWPKLKHDVAKFIRQCKICLETKPEQKKAAGYMLSKVPTTSRPWQLISMDIVGPLPRSTAGNSYILSVCDCFSKFTLLFPLRTANAATIVKLLEDHVILIFGAPNKAIVDNGVQFRSHVFKDLMSTYDIDICYTALYHPQCNPVERIHRVVKTMLSAYVKDNHKIWDRYLSKVAFAIRSARHDVTGLTPNFINFGREVTVSGKSLATVKEPINFDRDDQNILRKSEVLSKVFEDVTKRLKYAYNREKKVYNLRRRADQFSINQTVWKRNYVISDGTNKFTAKLAPKFIGPLKIIKVVSPWSYELADNLGNSRGIWHAKDLKAHPPDSDK